MVDKELLDILVCPETKQDLTLADEALVDKINARIAAGTLMNRCGQKVEGKIDYGLVRSDKKFLYIIRDDIPVMLIDEAIALEGIL
ncbi:MAG: Trm112 family protein [Candidatus Omnitrophota bacterium]|nr:Trm112 family protein [Candidatus Omnitrophota bacterium]